MLWTKELSPTEVKWIGFAKLLGGMGVILPSLLFYRWAMLAPSAAIGLALILIGAVLYNIFKRDMEQLFISGVMLLMAVFMVYQSVIH